MNNETKQINTCEVCDNKELTSVLNLGLHPMCDDLIPIGSSQSCQEYPIEILFCNTCVTAHQRYQVPKKDLFPVTYHYRSRFTADVLNGMKELVNSCEQKNGFLKDKSVLDIGCNDGSLLNFFKEKGAITFGIEPTNACLDARLQGHIAYNDFLSEALATRFVAEHGQPDVIVFTNVFAHIENLKEVVRALKILISSQTMIVIENHYLGAVLDGNQFDTFYHEHPRTYSYTSFEFIAKSLGITLLEVEFPARYGGNIRIFMGPDRLKRSDQAELQVLKTKESKFVEAFVMMQKNILHWAENKRRFIQDYVAKNGKLKAKAFPGRAAILVKLLQLDENLISAVYEKPGSLKIGHYLPGTRIPIHSDNEWLNSQDKTAPILNLAWHIPKEIQRYLQENGYTGTIFPVLSANDFQSSDSVAVI